MLRFSRKRERNPLKSPGADGGEGDADQVTEGGRRRQPDDQHELGRVHHHVDRVLDAVDDAAHVVGHTLQNLDGRKEDVDYTSC